MGAPTLDYRSSTPAAAQTYGVLRRGDYWLAGRIVAKAGIGLVVLGVPTFFLAAVIARIWPEMAGFEARIVSFFVAGPLLFWWELRTRGRFFEEQAREMCIEHSPMSPGQPSTQSRGEWEYRGARATIVLYVEIFLIGPRLIIEAVAEHNAWRKCLPVDFNEAVHLLFMLHDREDGIPAVELALATGSADRMFKTLEFLRFHDWVDGSRSGDRWWLLSRARAHLDKIRSRG